MRCHRATILDSVSCVNLKPMERVEALRAETEPSTGSVYDSLTDGRTQPRIPTFPISELNRPPFNTSAR